MTSPNDLASVIEKSLYNVEEHAENWAKHFSKYPYDPGHANHAWGHSLTDHVVACLGNELIISPESIAKGNSDRRQSKRLCNTLKGVYWSKNSDYELYQDDNFIASFDIVVNTDPLAIVEVRYVNCHMKHSNRRKKSPFTQYEELVAKASNFFQRPVRFVAAVNEDYVAILKKDRSPDNPLTKFLEQCGLWSINVNSETKEEFVKLFKRILLSTR